MGKDARRMTRWSTTIVLVGAVSSVAAGVAFANAAGGVHVPDSTFRQGTGTQEIDISVAGPAVGSTEALVIWPTYNSRNSDRFNNHWLLGVIADPATGARCGYDAGQWQCVPGRSGWHAGDLHVQVSTADAMYCGPARGVCAEDQIEVQSIPYGPNPMGGSSGGSPISISGTVVILPSTQGWSGMAPRPSAPARSHPSLAKSSTPAPRTSSAGASPGSAEVTRSSAPSTSASATSPPALVPMIGPSLASIDAENTSLTAQQGSDLGFYAALLIPVFLGVAVPVGYHANRRRRGGKGRHAGSPSD